MKKTLLFITIIAVLLIAGCTQKTNIQEKTDVIEKPINAETTETTTQQTKEIIITAKNWEFDPSTITVNKGDHVILKITSIEGTHGFALPEFGISERLVENKEVIVEFSPDKTGTFGFYCSVPCGKGHTGMNGQLVVE